MFNNSCQRRAFLYEIKQRHMSLLNGLTEEPIQESTA